MSIGTEKKLIDKIQETIGLDLALVLIFATLLIVFALTLPEGYVLRIIFCIPFLLFLPGYALVSALWPEKSEMEGLERAALGLGLSIAIVAIFGLGLNYTPWGIALPSVVIGLYSLILLLVIIAWLRRSKLGLDKRFILTSAFLFEKSDQISSTDKVMILIVAIVMIIGGGTLAYIAVNPPKEPYTQLSIKDEYGATENYPFNLSVDEDATIIIEVVCYEREATDYSVLVSLKSDSQGNTTLDEYNFSLADGKKWSQDIDFSINASGEYKLEVELFKNDERTPYANNYIWINVQ
jgi:uncharacterized membrane protein